MGKRHQCECELLGWNLGHLDIYFIFLSGLSTFSLMHPGSFSKVVFQKLRYHPAPAQRVFLHWQLLPSRSSPDHIVLGALLPYQISGLVSWHFNYTCDTLYLHWIICNFELFAQAISTIPTYSSSRIECCHFLHKLKLSSLCLWRFFTQHITALNTLVVTYLRLQRSRSYWTAGTVPLSVFLASPRAFYIERTL